MNPAIEKDAVAVVIPFRDRGIDPRRSANLEVVLWWWWAHGYTPLVCDDGQTGDAQFNRHRAYNTAVARRPNAEVFVFSEADMILPPAQIKGALALAAQRVGLVVPFSEYRYLSDETTGRIRDAVHDDDPKYLAARVNEGWPFHEEPDFLMGNRKSIGAVNVVSAQTLKITGGFTEATSGNWYDDNITEEGFAYLTGNRTRWVDGSAVHLYHLPGHSGDHLSVEDRRATRGNKEILYYLRKSIKVGSSERVRRLMGYRQESERDQRQEKYRGWK